MTQLSSIFHRPVLFVLVSKRTLFGAICLLLYVLASGQIHAQSTSTKPWDAYVDQNWEKAEIQATKLLDQEENHALALCVKGWLQFRGNDEMEAALTSGLLAQKAWRTNVTGEQRTAWRAVEFGASNIQELIDKSSSFLAERVISTPTLDDDVQFLNQWDGIPSHVIAQVNAHVESMEFGYSEAEGTEKAYQNFLDSYPMSEWSTKAALAIEEIHFLEASESNTSEEWGKFVRLHPTSRHAAEANLAIQELIQLNAVSDSTSNPSTISLSGTNSEEELEEFRLAEAEGTLEAFQSFVDSYPFSPLSIQASEVMDSLSFAEAREANSMETWRAFIRQHPSSNRLEEAVAALDKLAWNRAKSFLNPNVLDGYLGEFPKGSFRQQAVRMRDSLEWQQAIQASTLEALQDFVAKRPESHLTEEAGLAVIEFIWDETSANPNEQNLVQFIQEHSQFPQANLAAELLNSMCMDRHLESPLVAILSWDDELTELDVLNSVMSVRCRFGRREDYDSFAQDFAYELASRPDLKSRLTQAQSDMYDVLSPSDWLQGDDSWVGFTSLHAQSYKAYQTVLNEWTDEGRTILIRNVQTLIRHGWKNPWAESLVEAANKKATSTPVKLSSNLNTDEHDELVPVISADNQQLFFCRHFNDGRSEDVYVSRKGPSGWGLATGIDEINTFNGNQAPLNISTDGTELLGFLSGEISISTRNQYGWTSFQPIDELNTKSWNADAQLVSTKDAYLFAAGDSNSDDIDIYVARVDRYGNILEPEPLGPTINTPFRDRSPFLHPDMKTLYFSSSGHGGFGSLDIFMSKRLADTCWNCWSEPVNLGFGINAKDEDWGFHLSTDGEMAYYSKNGDLCSLKLPKDVRPELVATVEGVLVDKYDQPADARIIWEDLETGSTVGQSNTDPVTGRYFIVLPTGKIYGYYVESEGYFGTSSSLDLRSQDKFEVVEEDIELVYLENALDTENDVTIRVNNLFFEYGSEKLVDLSKNELQRVAQLLLDFQRPVMLTGHTDNTGGDDYNLDLSLKRASSVKQALMELGVSEDLLEVDGKGESMPVASNDTPQGRQKNRRVELKFLGE